MGVSHNYKVDNQCCGCDGDDNADNDDKTDEKDDNDEEDKTDEKDENDEEDETDEEDNTDEKDNLVCNTRRLAPSSQRPRITHQNVFTWEENKTNAEGNKTNAEGLSKKKESEEKIWTELSEEKEQEIVGIEKGRVVSLGEKEK